MSIFEAWTGWASSQLPNARGISCFPSNPLPVGILSRDPTRSMLLLRLFVISTSTGNVIPFGSQLPDLVLLIENWDSSQPWQAKEASGIPRACGNKQLSTLSSSTDRWDGPLLAAWRFESLYSRKIPRALFLTWVRWKKITRNRLVI